MYWTLKKMISWLTVIVFVGIIVGYAYYQSRSIVAGPQITISEPQNGATFHEPLIDIRGTSKNSKSLTLDGRPIFVDLSGNFYEKLVLEDGYNIIDLIAKDAEGRETKRTLELVYAQDDSVSTSLGVASSSIDTTATGSSQTNN